MNKKATNKFPKFTPQQAAPRDAFVNASLAKALKRRIEMRYIRISIFPIIFMLVGCLNSSVIDKSSPTFETRGEHSQSFYPTGELRYDYKYKNGIREGVTREYFKNGKRKADFIYKSGVLIDGKGFYPTGELREDYKYKNGIPEGVTRRYYKNGKRKADFIYKSGVIIDDEGFYETGELRYKHMYENGVKEGGARHYYKNGKRKADFMYKSGVKIDGESFYETGELRFKYMYENGKREGYSIEYNKDGAVKNKFLYKNNRLMTANAHELVKKEFTKEQAQQYIRLLAFSVPVMGLHRMTQIECSDLYPENSKKYESYFKKGNYERVENVFKKLMPEPRKELETRKKISNELGLPHQDMTKAQCAEMLNGVKQINELLEPNNEHKIDVDDLILFVEKVTKLNDKDFTEYFGSLK